jgi:hypothetical protein
MVKQFLTILYAELQITRPLFPENRRIKQKKERDDDLKLPIVSLDFVKRNIRISGIESQT